MDWLVHISVRKYMVNEANIIWFYPKCGNYAGNWIPVFCNRPLFSVERMHHGPLKQYTLLEYTD